MTATTIIAPRAGSRQRRISPLVPAAGPACCGVLMEPTGSPGCWKCLRCGLTVTPFRLAVGGPTAQYECCGVPMTRRGNRWECDECFGWATAHHRPAADTQPHPPMNRRAARSACTQGR